MGGIRLRLWFKDLHILSDSQISEGLKQSWFFLNPQIHKTINDLSSYLLHSFQLHASCPHGILLFMDGFLLPPFESTCILKDNDIVSVKKKGGHLAVDRTNGPNLILAVEGNNGPNVVENLQIVEKQPVVGGKLLLANEEFGHGAESYESYDNEPPEDESKKEEVAEPREDTSRQESALGGYRNSKKRKASEKTTPSSKKKKHHSGVVENLDKKAKKQQKLTSEENLDKKAKKQQKLTSEENLDKKAKKQQKLTSKKSHHKKRSASEPNDKKLENNKGSTESCENDDVTPSMKKNDELQKNGVENIVATTSSDETELKVLKQLVDMSDGRSRSARRKAAKRKWLRETAKTNAVAESDGPQNGKELQAEDGRGESSGEPNEQVNEEANGQPKGHLNWEQQKTKNNIEEVTNQPKGLLQWEEFHGEDDNIDTDQKKHAEEKTHSCGKSCQISESEDEVVVPVEIRPGHIRFEPLGKGHASKQSRVEMESFRWNGSMSKKKGQKWGQEKVSFSQKNDHLGSNEEHAEMMNGERQKGGQEEVPLSQKADFVDPNSEHPEMVNGEKEHHSHESIDFNTLPFLSGLPKEGLVIAYRLIELSSTWTPEVSSYRVGKISQYNSEANKILLMPVAEFPVFSSEEEVFPSEEESSEQPDSSPYNEDGSLEIEFSSLLEVRLVKDDTPKSAGIPAGVTEASAANESTPVLQSSNKKTDTSAVGHGDVNNGKQVQSTCSEDGGVDPWNEFSEILKAKKAELSKESSLEKGESSGKKSWSYRAVRGSALGPIMALLRSQNEI